MKIAKNKYVYITPYGILLVSMDLIIFMSAVISGKFTLLIMALFLLSVLIIAFIVGFFNISGLQLFRRLPDNIYRFKPVLCELGIKNEKKYLGSFLITIQDLIENLPLDKSCYFFKISPRGKLSTFYRHAFVERGRFTYEGIAVSSIFPFGLFRFMHKETGKETILIYPDFQKELSVSQKNIISGYSDSSFGLRRYIPGDHPKSIHWPASLKQNILLSRISSVDTVHPVWLRIDNRLIPDESGGYIKAYEDFERKVSLAVSYAWYFLYTGKEVGIIARNGVLYPVAGMASFDKVLNFFSEISFSEKPFGYLELGEFVIDIHEA